MLSAAWPAKKPHTRSRVEMQFARQVADNALFMDNGVVVEYGKAEEVIGHPHEERTRQFLDRYFQQ